VHLKFADGKELAEEYNMETGAVIRRAWKVGRSLTSEPEWEVEVGECGPPGFPKLTYIQEPDTAVGILQNNRAVTRSRINRRLPYNYLRSST